MATSQQDIKNQLITELRARLENRKKGVRDNPTLIDNLCDFLFLNKDKENKPVEKLTLFGEFTLENKEHAINKIIYELNGSSEIAYTNIDIRAAINGETGKILFNPIYSDILPPNFKLALKQFKAQEKEQDIVDAKCWIACNRK